MIGETDVVHRNVIQTSIVDASDDVVEHTAELMCRIIVVDHPVVAVQSNVEATCDVDRRLERGNLVNDGG